MNGKLDERAVLKQAMEVAEDDKLHYGVSPKDILAMLKLVVKMHAEKGKKVNFKWKRVDRNHSTVGKGWSGKNCSSTFKKNGKYVVVGKTKRANAAHEAHVKKISLAREEEDKLKVFASYAKGEKRADHAIGINVNDDGVGVMVDNGCTPKELNILNLAKRMEDVKACYILDLFYEK